MCFPDTPGIDRHAVAKTALAEAVRRLRLTGSSWHLVIRAVPHGPVSGPDGAAMGEGVYRSPDGRTVIAEPYDDLDPGDIDGRGEAWDDLTATVLSCLSSSWTPVWRAWRNRER